MKIVTVCSMGIGTSILLKMNVEAVLDRLGMQATVEASDLSSARGVAASADLILTNTEMARALDDIATRVVVIRNFMDMGEIQRGLLTLRDRGE